jgi:DSF synthase
MSRGTVAQMLSLPLKQVKLGWDDANAVLRITLSVRPIQCFSLSVLNELKTVLAHIDEMPSDTVRQLVVCSDVAGVFNFGGDLSLFVLLARARSRCGLVMYGRLCVDLVHWLEGAAGRGIHTLALIKGDALGGGLECVLPMHRVVMECGASAGFPETLFNLYPGMAPGTSSPAAAASRLPPR